MIYKPVLAVLSVLPFSSALNQWFPLLKKDETRLQLVPFQTGTAMPVECMVRNIDNGEHQTDANDEILFAPFPVCKETNKPLTLQYGVNEDLTCTILLTDEMYHLFQLYIHEDAPFSCRLPISNEPGTAAAKGLAVPLLLNFRGTLSDSHIHIDTNLNLLNVKPASFNSLISSTLFSSSTNVTRVIIGDYLKLNFAVRWLDVDINPADIVTDESEYHYASGFYKLPLKLGQSQLTGVAYYIIITLIISSLATYASFYAKFNKRNPNEAIFDSFAPSKRD